MTRAMSSARIGELYSELDRFLDFAGRKNDPAPVRGNPDYRDPPAPKYPLSPKAKAALARYNQMSRCREFFRQARSSQELGNFPIPREPGKAPVPDRVIWERAGAERDRINKLHIAALERALANAKKRSL